MSGLGTTAPVGVEDVMCPSNATSASECNATSPPMTPRCFGNFSAAGVRCIQGVYQSDVNFSISKHVNFYYQNAHNVSLMGSTLL